MDLLHKLVHDPALGEFPCARACVAAGDALGRAEEEEPLLEDIPPSRVGVGSRKRWGVRIAVALACQAAGGDHRANAAEELLLFALRRASGFGPGSPGSLWTLLELLAVGREASSGSLMDVGWLFSALGWPGWQLAWPPAPAPAAPVWPWPGRFVCSASSPHGVFSSVGDFYTAVSPHASGRAVALLSADCRAKASCRPTRLPAGP